MNIDAGIFGDQFAEEIGRTLLAYFECKEFPKCLLHDQTLNLLYLNAQADKILHDKSLSDTARYALMGAAFDLYYENGGEPLPVTEKMLRHRFFGSGVEK